MIELILRTQAVAVVAFMASFFWYVRVAWRGFKKGERREALGFVNTAAMSLWGTALLALGLLRRNAEAKGLPSSWLLDSPVQLAIYVLAIAIALSKLAVFSRSRLLVATGLWAATALFAWPDPVLTLFTYLYNWVAPSPGP